MIQRYSVEQILNNHSKTGWIEIIAISPTTDSHNQWIYFIKQVILGEITATIFDAWDTLMIDNYLLS